MIAATSEVAPPASPGRGRDAHPLLAAAIPAAALLAAVLASGCGLGDDMAEQLVEKTARRNEERLIEQQREELPLPDPAEVPYKRVSASDIEPADDFVVSLEPDLSLDERGNDQHYVFQRFAPGNAKSVAVDSEGRIFVLETRAAEVRVFDPDGRFLHEFGRPGEGPADFQRPLGMVIAGDEVFVFHRTFFASVWTPDGEYLREATPFGSAEEIEAQEAAPNGRRFRRVLGFHGLADGSIVSGFRAVTPEDRTGRIVTPFERVIGRFRAGAQTLHYIAAPEWAGVDYAVGADGAVYVSLFGHLRNEHYIVAFSPDGSPRWVVATPWDERVPSRATLKVDGAGRLLVFPNAFVEPAPQPADGGAAVAVDEATGDREPVDDRVAAVRRPVQVYSREGELVGSGYIAKRTAIEVHWHVADGAYVYGIDANRLTGELEPARFRLVVGGPG